MRRRFRAPPTQLARAGERTRLLISDGAVPLIRFKATTLTGTPAGSVMVERVGQDPETRPLEPDNLIDGEGFLAMSVVPDADTAITFVPADPPKSPMAVIVGLVLIGGAILWTAAEFVGF